ncbi:NOTCH2 [Mytilus coruscus]|uniref:NOTCH2 n=1 Tax=Mytilus coruscus TaxID=42192 RepID=A0A6J8CIG2_MYTCO|nr:NOTCH2 [Mytilus coruscus]
MNKNMNGSFKAKTNIIAEGSRFNDVMNMDIVFAMDTDRCLPTNPCKEDTRCLPTNSNGHVCSTFVTPCTASPCMHGYCNITNAGYKCTCDVGYSGVNCEFNPCMPNPCKNGGTCTVRGGNTYRCACFSNTGGSRCQFSCGTGWVRYGTTCYYFSNFEYRWHTAQQPSLCSIINAYMPTINTNSETQYSECLDIIFDTIEKYQSNYVIILAGDLNWTLLQTRTNKHDRMLREFVQEVSLFLPDIGNQPTFFHHAHHGSSQIDYTLSNRNNLSKKYCILDKSYANTSAHCAAFLQTNINIPLLVHNTSRKKITKTKVLWEKRDEEKYRETIRNEFLHTDLPTLEIDQQIDTISNALINAQKQSIPSKITQLKGPKWKASPEVTVLLKMCKVLYNK